LRFSRRLFLLQMLLLTACGVKSTPSQSEELIIGLVGYEEGEEALNRYTKFNNYLSEKTGAIVKLEPTFNETQALERIHSPDFSR